MAKRRRRRKTFGTQLKYEIYGILLITISIIALSGEAAVGRSLSKLFGLVLGKYFFVLALIGIYVGLSVMIKRAWPKGWSNRRLGIVIIVMALTLGSSMSEINYRFEVIPRDQWSGGLIFSELNKSLKMELIASDPSPNISIRDKRISGGYVGAVQYTAFFTLFGYYGALLLMIVMIAISIMLITGRSYIDILRIVVKKTMKFYKLFQAKYIQWTKKRTNVQKAKQIKNNKTPIPPDEEISVTHYDQYKDEDGDDSSAQLDQTTDRLTSARKNAKKTFTLQTIGDRVFDFWEKKKKEREQQTAEETNKEGQTTERVIDLDDDKLDNVRDHHVVEQYHAPSIATSKEDELHNITQHSGMTNLEENENSYDLPSSEAIITAAQSLEGAPRRPIGLNNQSVEEVTILSSSEKPYQMPPFSLLNKPQSNSKNGEPKDLYDSRRKLEATLESFGVRAHVLDVIRGPAVTRYEVQPAEGVKVRRIVGLADDIALALAAKDIRMEAPIPGKSAIGIEVPNLEVSIVTMREVMETAAFQKAASKLSIAFGRDISGQTIVGNLTKMPHLLVAGATGSGKSVCINGIITSILYKATPDEVKFLMIDPKMVELNMYNGIPHLIAPVVTDPRRASLALKKIVVEMENRYEQFSKSSTRNIEGYNAMMAGQPDAVLPYIVVIVDELADLMMVAANDVEESIARLAQKARASGIHLILATQRPSVDVITGVIKANIPSRIAFGVSSQVDSRTILDMVGAEKLLGRGDMLFLPVGMSKPIRVQGAFLSDPEVEALVAFTREQAEAEYNEELVPEIEEEDENAIELDELYNDAVQIVVEAKQASVSLLQRRMRIGYNRAGRLIDQMETKGIIGPYEGSKPREVLVTEEQLKAN
ncbi:DNA translocase FtsK 4TM domain-containing protein [Paenibacillus yanchengensis]|uniref:DNA translocase FtsK 4TM domain-containing protein n=1 Tax=Paenibacillus yanchengensis TaxID=2035833 RepID=A0ABW4YM84_9BACL